MSYEKYFLENELKVILKHKETKSIHIQINFNVGSINEEEGEKGYSHLVEHLLFEGTSKRPNAQVICSEIENLGGEVNAATSNEMTYYYIKIPSKHYEKAINVLADMTQNSTFKEKIIQKEKKIVLEEIKMVNDQPRYYQWILFEKNLLEGTLYENPVYGLVKDVENANRKTVVNYYQKHYCPNNATITILGDLNANKKQIKQILEKEFSKWNKQKISSVPVQQPINKERTASQTKDIQQTYLIQGITTPKITHEDSPTIEVIQAILGKPQSGRINNEIRTKEGLAYDVSVSYDNFRDFGFFAINVGADSTNIEKVKQILETQYKLENLGEEELTHAKNYIEGKEILELEDIHHEADLINFWENTAGDDLTKEYLQKIQKVTLEDVKRVSASLFSNLTEVKLTPKNF